MEPIYRKLRQAEKSGKIKGKNFEELMAAAAAANIMPLDELKQIKEVYQLHLEIVSVDEFL